MPLLEKGLYDLVNYAVGYIFHELETHGGPSAVSCILRMHTQTPEAEAWQKGVECGREVDPEGMEVGNTCIWGSGSQNLREEV